MNLPNVANGAVVSDSKGHYIIFYHKGTTVTSTLGPRRINFDLEKAGVNETENVAFDWSLGADDWDSYPVYDIDKKNLVIGKANSPYWGPISSKDPSSAYSAVLETPWGRLTKHTYKGDVCLRFNLESKF